MTTEAERQAGQPESTYEDFANQPFYVDINRQTVALLPQVRNVVDIATGTGAIITQLIEQKKLLPGFEVKGYDIDEGSLRLAREKFGVFNSQIKFENASAEFIPLGNDWADAVTFCNAIHLTNSQYALYEAARILKPGGVLVVNSAYASDLAYPDNSRRTWGVLLALARRLAQKGYGLSDPQDPANILKYTSEDFRQQAELAGFETISTDQIVTRMNREDLEAICRYKEFTEGAMPDVDYKIAKDCLQKAVPLTLKGRNTDSLPRGWMVMYAFKKAA